MRRLVAVFLIMLAMPLFADNLIKVPAAHAAPLVQPPAPAPLLPGIPFDGNFVIANLTPTLAWTDVGANSYAVAISKFPYGTTNITYNPQFVFGTSIAVPAGVLEPDTRYRWNLQARDASGLSLVSNTLYFQTPSVDARIDSYSPTSRQDVEVGQSIILGVTFTNTGGVPWKFVAGATVWDSLGQEVANYEFTLVSDLQPGDQWTAAWSHPVNAPGDYWVQFGVWKQKPFIAQNLLDAKPSPSQNLFSGVSSSAPCYDLTTTLSPSGSGNISISPSGNCPGDPSRYAEGTIVLLTASDTPGWQFSGWSGACSGTGFCQVTMDANKSVTATFNHFPVANAGLYQDVLTGDTVQLDGSGSSDLDGDPLTYNWQFVIKPVGSAAVLSNPSLVNPTFVPDVAGHYRIELIVNDGLIDSTPGEVDITANDQDQNPPQFLFSIPKRQPALTGAGGIAVDSNGNVYASLGTDQLVKLDSTGSEIWRVGKIGSANGQFNVPMGVATDSLGNVYVVDSGNYRIQVFDSNGNFLRKWGIFGFGNGQFAFPFGIALDSTGNIYVIDVGNDLIQVFDSNGNFLRKWVNRNQFDSPGIIAVDSVGDVYIPDVNNIKKFDFNGNLLIQWGGRGSGNGQFDTIGGVATDSLGNVYVADRGNYRIQVFDSNGNFLRKWSTFGFGNGQFSSPGDIAVDRIGNVYVTNGNFNLIQKFDSSGNFLLQWGTFGSGNGQFADPSGIAVDGVGNVYVTDSNNDRIQVFDSSGNFLRKWGTSGSDNDQLLEPHDVAVDNAGNVYVTDNDNDRIQKFDSNGKFLLQWGTEGSGNGQFEDPDGIAVDALGNVYVTDTSSGRIQVFDSSGNFLRKWGTEGSSNGQFEDPDGIAVDALHNVYVADSGNNRIQVFDFNGNFLLQWGTFGAGQRQFENPLGIAVDSAGNVYVADSDNSRIQVFDSNGNFLRKWGTFGSRNGQFAGLSDIAVDGMGNIYVADSNNRRVQVFSAIAHSPVNLPPTAHAGQDQTVTDADNDGSENVTLDGSGSFDPDGSIIDYSWSKGNSVIATGVSPTVALSIGTHTVTLTVTDDKGATDTDDVTIVVNPTSTDSFADFGNLTDEASHNLVGWGAAQVPPGQPFVSPSGDTTKRFQPLRGDASLDLLVPAPGQSHLLIAEVEDGACTDNFKIFVGGQEIHDYIGKNVGGDPFNPDIISHQVVVPSALLSQSVVTITFRNTSTDNCGVAAVFNVSLSPDTDGDGIHDWRELNSYDYDNDGQIDVNLPAMGADPMRKDIFVEIDWMETGGLTGHSHRPDPDAIQMIIDAFTNSPVTNPDGSEGISLHVDFGGNSLGQFSQGEAVPHDDVLGTIVSGNYDWADFDAVKAAHFSPARASIFHYALFVHSIGQSCGPSGISRGIPSSDFIVALGGWFRVPFSGIGDPIIDVCLGTLFNGSREQQAGTFMHELGHNLDLQHGGNDSRNYKPNYLSVMNYAFTMRGIIIDEQEEHFDYSRFSTGVPTLREDELREESGLSGGGIPNGYGTRRFNCDQNNPQYIVVRDANAPIDWNCNGNIEQNSIQANVNGDSFPNATNLPMNQRFSNVEELTTWNDWSNLKYDGGLIGLGLSGDLPVMTPINEMTPEDAARVQPVNVPPTADANGPYTADEGSPVTLDASGSSDPDGAIVSFEWDLDSDGQFDDAIATSTDVTFPDNGVFTVGVRATDGVGAFDVATSTVTVLNVAPSVDAGTDHEIAVGDMLTRDISFSDPGALDSPWSFTIDWGDGSADATGSVINQSSPITEGHLYSDPGVYNVQACVTDKDGGTGCDTSVVTVIDAGTITIEKITAPAGGAGFGFSHDIQQVGAAGSGGSFSLDDGDSQTFLEVLPGQYAIAEDDPSAGGFTLTDLTCQEDVSANSTTNVGTRTATLVVEPGEDIRCTFTNSAVSPPGTNINSQLQLENVQVVSASPSQVITATFRNVGSMVLTSVTFRVALLEGGELVNREVGTPAGTGAELTAGLPAGGLLPGDTFDVVFEVLPATSGGPFTFTLDAFS